MTHPARSPRASRGVGRIAWAPGAWRLLLLAMATLGLVLWPLVSARRPEALLMTVWGQPFEDALFRDQYARGFEAAHPGRRVEYQRHADLETKYLAWHSRGRGPELMRLRVTDYHLMVERGMLMPLSPMLVALPGADRRALLDSIPRSLLDPLRIGAELYALPQDSAQFGLYYNPDLFDDYNRAHPDEPLPYPTEGWTWEDLRSAASRLTRRSDGGDVLVAGFDMVVWEWPIMHFILQAGGELWHEGGLRTRIDEEPGVRALMFLASLVRDGSWSPEFVRAGTMGPDARFASGRVAMYLDGSWMVPSFETRAPGLRFAVAPPPRGERDVAIAGSVLWGISAHARDPEGAWSLLRYVVAEPQARAYWNALRVAPPANLDVLRSEAFRAATGLPDRFGSFIVPPMPEADFEAKASWLVRAMTPGPDGNARAVVPAGLYQPLLERELRGVLQAFLERPDDATPERARNLLRAAAARVHAQIDADRRAKGLPPGGPGPEARGSASAEGRRGAGAR